MVPPYAAARGQYAYPGGNRPEHAHGASAAGRHPQPLRVLVSGFGRG